MDIREEQDKRKIEEYKKIPMSNFSDSINNSKVGDLGQLTKGGYISKIITTILIIQILYLLFHY